jgi:hypothetical protein
MSKQFGVARTWRTAISLRVMQLESPSVLLLKRLIFVANQKVDIGSISDTDGSKDKMFV